MVPVRSLHRALVMRRIRNECAQYMTRDQRQLSVVDQIKFWRRYRDDPNRHAFLCQYGNRVVGYGIIYTDQIGYSWVSGGVTEGFRGKHAGRFIFQFLTERSPRPARLEVLASNARAIRLYESLGWRHLFSKQTDHGQIKVMVH